MSLVGSPTASRMMARVNTPPAGIPAAPTLDAVAVTLDIRREDATVIKVHKGSKSHKIIRTEFRDTAAGNEAKCRIDETSKSWRLLSDQTSVRVDWSRLVLGYCLLHFQN